MPLGRFTAKAQAAIERAQQMAMERNQGEMRALHLLYVLLDEERKLLNYLAFFLLVRALARCIFLRKCCKL